MTTFSNIVLALLLAAAPAAADSQCYSAEPLADGLGYHVRNGISVNGRSLQFVSFTSPAGQTLAGRGEVKTRNVGGIPTKGFQLDKISARLTSQTAPTNVTVRYVDFGGGVNLHINGETTTAARLRDLDGRTIAGVVVRVQETQGLPRIGTLQLTGAAPSFTIGGNQLLLREACL
jgi:hypothetical protein